MLREWSLLTSNGQAITDVLHVMPSIRKELQKETLNMATALHESTSQTPGAFCFGKAALSCFLLRQSCRTIFRG